MASLKLMLLLPLLINSTLMATCSDRWHDYLEFSDEAGPGDFIYVPQFVSHHEINALQDEACECVIVRSGQEPIVFNLQIDMPEPASAGHLNTRRIDTSFHPSS